MTDVRHMEWLRRDLLKGGILAGAAVAGFVPGGTAMAREFSVDPARSMEFLYDPDIPGAGSAARHCEEHAVTAQAVTAPDRAVLLRLNAQSLAGITSAGFFFCLSQMMERGSVVLHHRALGNAPDAAAFARELTDRRIAVLDRVDRLLPPRDGARHVAWLLMQRTRPGVA